VILVECEQGSPEWHAARAGCITASNFKLTRTGAKLKSGPNKGEYNEKAKDYAFRLAIERIAGKPLDVGFVTWQMKRGHELGRAARAAHEMKAGVVAQRAGFLITDDRLFGASADGLIDFTGGSEYKCLVSPESLREVLMGDDISEYMDQIQGCMWITGRQWWHFALYCPALEPAGKQLYWREIKRNDEHIEAMESDLIEFEKLVSKFRYQLEHLQAGPETLQLAA